MAIFKLTWIGGDTSLVEGNSVVEAFNASYGAGAMKALDFHKEVDLSGEWVLNKSVPFSKVIRDIYLLASDERIEKVVVRNTTTGEVSEGNIRLR
jgi:hypothetical protein